jgi:hypothetical protein
MKTMELVEVVEHAQSPEIRDSAKAALVERIEQLEKDAERYRWLRGARCLDLRSDGSVWKHDDVAFVASHRLSAGGTQYGTYGTLAELIDTAMKGETP